LKKFLCVLCFGAAANFLFAAPWHVEPQTLVDAARKQIGVTRGYDPAYHALKYPGGDVPRETGVCCDVIVRALRDACAIDLQKEVHEAMSAHFERYPKQWSLKKPDANIDHRRVPNLQMFFKERGFALPAADYRPGDIVTWRLPFGATHIGLVSDKTAPSGTPLIIHNIGQGAQEEDILFLFTITGHYRIP